MNDLAPNHRRILRRWLAEVHDRYDHYDFPIHFIRVLTGDKPATCIQKPNWSADDSPFETEEEFLAFIEELGLSSHQQKKHRNHTVSRSAWRLELLPSAATIQSKEALHRRLGVVFGYPHEDIEWFIHSSSRTTPRERVTNGAFTPEEMAYVDFLAYKNEDSITGFERAIEEGKRVRELLATIANEWDLPIIDRIAADHYQLSVEVYSGDRKTFPGEFTEFKMIAWGD